MKAHKLLPLAEVLLAVVIAGGEEWVLFRGVFLLGDRVPLEGSMPCIWAVLIVFTVFF